MQDLIEILSAMVSKRSEVPDPRELLLDVGERIVKRVSGTFGVKADEVAILLVTSDGRHLRFVSPRQFVIVPSECNVTVPISRSSSISL